MISRLLRVNGQEIAELVLIYHISYYTSLFVSEKLKTKECTSVSLLNASLMGITEGTWQSMLLPFKVVNFVAKCIYK